MTKLSVNINKIATLRNARGGNYPDLLLAAKNIERFGADGITVHPRPDERHITYQDVRALAPILTTEFNIEGNPHHQAFMDLVLDIKPQQVTLVPDTEGQLTSDHGWDTVKNLDYLKETISLLKKVNIRASIFLDADETLIDSAKKTGADRIELYTEYYAKNYTKNKNNAIKNYIIVAKKAADYQLGINAGHDLDFENLAYFATNIPNLLEVSIGHALVSDALYLGLENTVQLYKRALNLE